MKLEESEDPKQVFVDTMNEFKISFLGKVDKISKHLDYYTKSLEADEYNSAIDQLSFILSLALDSFVDMKSYIGMRQRLINFDETEQRTS